MIFPRRIFQLICCGTAALAGAATPLRAESPRGTLRLPEALALALKQNPELAGFEWERRAAEARIITARLRPNPEVSVEAENVTGTGDLKNGEQAERTLRLSQVVELGGKRPARIAEATAERELVEWEYQVKRVEVLRATTEAFIDVLAAQRLIEWQGETLGLWEKAVPFAERKVQVGQGSVVEVNRATIAVAMARIAVEQARRDLQIARGNLAAQWGARTANFEGVTGELDETHRVPSIETLRSRLLENPQLARWTAVREKREATLRLARAEGVPNVTASGGPRLEGRGEEVTGVIGFSMPLPLFSRNQGKIAEARANIGKAETERQAVEAKVFAELNKAYQTLRHAEEEVELLTKTVLPNAGSAVELVTKGYETGRSSQLEILEAQRTLTEARVQRLRALADYHKALAEIEALTARPASLPGHGTARTKTK